MRRMITNKQVVDIVNKGIEEGEIQAGGLPQIQEGDAGKVLTVNASETAAKWAKVNALPDIQEGDAGKLLAVNSGETGAEWINDNNLKLPESAPAAQQLVGINTSGEQNALGIGDGLTIENNQLKSNLIYTIDYGKNYPYTLTSDEIALFSSEARPKFVKVLYSGDIDRFKPFNNILFELNFNNEVENNSTGLWYSSSFNPDMDQVKTSYVEPFEIEKIKSQHLYGVTINLSNGECSFYENAKNKLVSDIKMMDGAKLEVRNGFESGSFPQAGILWSNFAKITYIITVDSVDYRVLFTPKTVDITNGKDYCYGEILTNTGVLKKYLLTIEFRAKTYAITEITQ